MRAGVELHRFTRPLLVATVIIVAAQPGGGATLKDKNCDQLWGELDAYRSIGAQLKAEANAKSQAIRQAKEQKEKLGDDIPRLCGDRRNTFECMLAISEYVPLTRTIRGLSTQRVVYELVLSSVQDELDKIERAMRFRTPSCLERVTAPLPPPPQTSTDESGEFEQHRGQWFGGTDPHPYREENNISSRRCLRRCLGENLCNSVDYHVESGKCLLYMQSIRQIGQIGGKELIEGAGWSHYEKRRRPES